MTFPNPLITLSDGRPGLRGTIQIATSAPPGQPTPYTLDFISSDESLDRYGEIITATGWNLDTYRRNPVFQNAHQYGDIIFTLGKALITEVRRPDPATPHSAFRTPHLFQRVQFAADVSPMARIAYGLYNGRFLQGVSVGFIPIRWELGNADSNFSLKYLEQELLEVSAVAIPANPNALALGLKSGAVQKSDLRDLAGLLAQTLSTHAPAKAPSTQAPPLTLQLTQLADHLRQILRRA